VSFYLVYLDYHWLESSWRRYSGCSVDLSVPGTLSKHSVPLVAGLLQSCALFTRCINTSIVPAVYWYRYRISICWTW